MAALDGGWMLYDQHEAGQHTKPVNGCGQCFRALEAEVERLRAAVLHFGQHDPSCPVRQEFTRDNPACLCGLDSLAPPAEVAGTDA